MAICEGLEDWGAATDLSNLSDSDEEDQPAPLVRFCYCHDTGSSGEIICYVTGNLSTLSLAAILATKRPQQVPSVADTRDTGPA